MLEFYEELIEDLKKEALEFKKLIKSKREKDFLKDAREALVCLKETTNLIKGYQEEVNALKAKEMI